MKTDPPQYVAPQPDPALAILQQQNEQQQTLAIQDRTSAATARLMQQYGTRVATAGNGNWSPLIAPPMQARALATQALYNTNEGMGHI